MTPRRIEKPTTGSDAQERRNHMPTPDMVVSAARRGADTLPYRRRQRDPQRGG